VSMIPQAELRARVTMLGVKKANAEAMTFHGTLKDISGESAEATLKADFEGRGFDEFKAAMTDAKLRAAVPIVQEARLKYDRGMFSSLRREIFLTQKAMSGLGSEHGIGSAVGGALLPFGKLGTAAVAASGPVLSLGGGLVSLTGSLVGAAEGAGALGIGLGGMATVGLAGIIPLAVSAAGSLKELTTAQTAYIAAVETYGVQSTQAETAGRKLLAAEKMAGKEAVGLVGTLDKVKEKWASITKPGKEALFGAMDDALDRVEKKLPLIGASANRSAKVGREGFDDFLDAVTGSDFDKFVRTMTTTEEHVIPQLAKATGDWGVVLERIATASAPSLERVSGIFEHWSKEVLGSTSNSHKLEGEVSHLTDDFMTWVHLLDASGSLLHSIFSAGEGSGNELVVDTTDQFREWGAWIDTHGPEVKEFFAETKEGVEALASILGHAGQDWFVMAQAMEPVETAILHILDDFAQIKIGGQSALTYLLGGFAALKVAIAAVKIKDLVEVMGWLRSSTRESAGAAEQETAALQGQADAAAAAAAANTELAASNKAVAESAQLSMLETGPIADAEKAGQMSMFPMGGGVMPVEKEAGAAAAGTESAAAGGLTARSFLGSLGTGMLTYGVGGLLVGQVVKEVAGGGLGEKVGEALQGAGIGAAIGSAIAPGIGTAIGAALGGIGSVILQSLPDDGAAMQEAGAKEARSYLNGFRKEQDHIRKEIGHGFLGREGERQGAGEIPGTEMGATYRQGGKGLRGLRAELRDKRQSAEYTDQPKSVIETYSKELTAVNRAIAGVKKARATFGESVKAMKGDIVLGMTGVNNDLVAGLHQADTAWGHGTKEWRIHAAEAMQGAVAAIRSGIEDGTVHAEKGQKRINELLERIHLTKGDDPFGLAEATVKSFKQSGEAAGAGVRAWEKKLDLMPPAARRSTVESTEGMLSAWAQGHPKLEAQVDHLVQFETQKLGHGASQMVSKTAGAIAGIAESFGEGATSSGKSIENILENMSAALAAMGSKDHPHFSAKVLSAASAAHHIREKTESGLGAQTGGYIVGGSGSGDRPGFRGEAGAYILNREATAAYGFARGGQVPLALEPGERYFSPREVSTIGAHNLAAMNAEVPRFHLAKGGALGPEPQISGPSGYLRDIGQDAIHQVYAGAADYIAKHKPKAPAGGGNAEYVGGGGPVAAQMWRSLHANGYNQVGAAGIIGNAGQESGLNPASIGSGGGGLLGFTTSPISLADLQAFAKTQGKPWDDVGLQMQFYALHENGIRGAMNSQPDAAAAARYFMDNWERPYVPTQNQAHREEVARWALAQGYQEGGAVPSVGTRKKWAGWTPEGHYAPHSAQALITGGEALGVPTSISPTPTTGQTASEKAAKEAASKSTPTEAVHWEMSHLGDSDHWGYPGEWCGAFQAAGMEAVGITPPSDYPAAASWATFGTPLGRDHIQAGAILDYGSAHVAMAISSSQQIQGNNHEGRVGTSEIGGIIGGSGLTAVRWPPYNGTTGPGAGAAPTEKVPGRFDGLATDKISVGTSTPKTIHGIQREEARRRKEKRAYEHAVTAAAGRPKLVAALQYNVTVLTTRLEQLRRAAAKLRQEIARKHFTNHLGGSLGNVTGFGKKIEASQRDYVEKNEYAQHVAELGPTEPILANTLPANATEAQQLAAEKQRQATEEAYVSQMSGYIHGKVEPAYMAVLDSEANWRDTILSGEQAASGFTSNQEFRIRVLERGIATINALTESTTAKAKNWAASKEGKAWRKANPKEQYPSWLQAQIETAADQRATLPMLRFEEAERRKVLGEGREEFYGGRKHPIQPPAAPLAGTGTFETDLIEVQGAHWPGLHSPMKHLPATRSAAGFGGAIWATQGEIADLGLQIAQANAGISPAAGGAVQTPVANTELTELEKEELLHFRQREAVGAALGPTLTQFEKSYPLPYAGAFAEGGVAMVGERGPELIHLPNGTRVQSNHDTERMLGGGDTHVVVNGSIHQEPGDTRDPIEVWMRDPRNHGLVRQVVNTTPKAAASGSAGRPYRP
jgi:hypothetical protein